MSDSSIRRGKTNVNAARAIGYDTEKNSNRVQKAEITRFWRKIGQKIRILDYHKYLKPAKPNKKMKIAGWEK